MTGAIRTPHEGDYRALAEDVQSRAPSLPCVMCGFSACIDRILDFDDVVAALATHSEPEAAVLREKLVRRALAGAGGEFEFAWKNGRQAFAKIAPKRQMPGGTSTQVAQQLATIGAKPLLALERRDRDFLSLLHPRVELAPVDSVAAEKRTQIDAAAHQIIEFVPGEADGKSRRADRIILRFSTVELEYDPEFARLSQSIAAEAGAAVLSGFNALPRDRIAHALDWSRPLVAAWKTAGTPLIHVELADFAVEEDRHRLLAGMTGLVNSIGMNASEFQDLVPVAQEGTSTIPTALTRLADDLQLDRLNVHADHWVISFTRGDPQMEAQALAYGSLTASARAAHGRIVCPEAMPAGAELHESPWPAIQAVANGHIVSAPTPYLARPASTVGLGDSFLGGTLAVLAHRSPTTFMSKEAQ